MLRKTAALAATLLLASAAGAQMQTTPPADAPQQSAIRANTQAAQADAAQAATTDAGNTDAQAQYQADLTAYDAALARHDARADRQAEHYRHQQRAYADAMAAWRAQDYACHHGSTRACNAPTPDPAAFW